MRQHLELLCRPAARKSSRPPIVLVHGAWHGAWCWEGNFLDYFPAHGWETYALSLRGHGGSEGRSRLRWISIAEYVEDLATVVSSLERAPILVGHSMGGFVVQKYLERHRVAGAVLLASVPPSGTARLNLRIFRRHPLVWLKVNLLMWLYPVVATPALAAEWFFSPAVPDDVVRRHHARLQNESYRAALDMLALDLPHPAGVDTPMAVLGGELDRMFTVPEIEATGKAYAVTATIFPGMAHNMMSEPGWRTVADWIGRWGSSLPGTTGAPAV